MANYFDRVENFPPAKTTEHIPLPTVTHAPPEFEYITSVGQTTLWVGFVLMLLSSLAFIALSWRVEISKRFFYQLTTLTAIISTFSYYAMATHSGSSFNHVWKTHQHKHDIPDTYDLIYRQIFWARFVDWLLTTPLILFNLAALAGLSGSNIFNLIAANIAMILTGLFASYGHGKSKWGWYAMSWIAFLFVLWNLGTNARLSANKKGATKVYSPLMFYTSVLWVIYLIIWAVSDISLIASPDATTIIYSVLDILAKPVFGFWLLTLHKKEKATEILVEGVWTEGFGHREGGLRLGGSGETNGD